MPEIEITDDQREYLEDLREELEADVVYGHVRLTDALQFLIDSKEGDLPVDAGSADAETNEIEAQVDATDADAPAEDAADDADTDADEDGDADELDADAEDAEDDDTDDEDAEDDDADGGDADAEVEGADAENEGDDESEESEDDAAAAAAPTPGGGDRLNAMMQLLDTHDDKWREGSGDARYEVELPDGSVETAQTKDDVRALLFKNY